MGFRRHSRRHHASGRYQPLRQFLSAVVRRGQWRGVFRRQQRHSTQIWKTDGTPAGTAVVTAIPNTPATRHPSFTVFSNNTLFFTEDGDNNVNSIWATDGSAPGAEHLLSDFGGTTYADPFPLAALNGNLFFSASYGVGSGSQLWISDGTSLGTRQVKVLDEAVSLALEGVLFNGNLYFSTFSPDGTQVRASDGTDAGTHQVGTLCSKARPTGYTVSGGKLFFVGNDGTNGLQIYSTDGVTITQVTAFANAAGGGIADLTDVNGTFFSSAPPVAASIGSTTWNPTARPSRSRSPATAAASAPTRSPPAARFFSSLPRTRTPVTPSSSRTANPSPSSVPTTPPA